MATSFSAGGLNLNPFQSNAPGTNAAVYGNAVNLGKIWKTNRGGSFKASDFIAQDIANKAAVQSAADQSDAYAMGKSLGAIGAVSAAEKQAKEIKDQAKKQASKSMFGSALGAVAGIGGTLLSGGNPMVGAVASKGGQLLGNLFG